MTDSQRTDFPAFTEHRVRRDGGSLYVRDFPGSGAANRNGSAPCRRQAPNCPALNFVPVKNPTDDRRSMWAQSRYRGRQRVYQTTFATAFPHPKVNA